MVIDTYVVLQKDCSMSVNRTSERNVTVQYCFENLMHARQYINDLEEYFTKIGSHVINCYLDEYSNEEEMIEVTHNPKTNPRTHVYWIERHRIERHPKKMF